VTWAMTSPSWTLTIFPTSWFLAERGIWKYYPNLAAGPARQHMAAISGGHSR
jgi:hypothetical protein